jgi:DNA-binding MarR family transcriptional regulator
MGRSLEVFTEIVTFQTRLWNDLDARIRTAHDLPLERFEVMRVIQDAGGSLRVNDIAQSLAITGGAASKLVDRLERSGYAERRPHPTDRRSALVSLTRSGRLAFSEALVTVESALDVAVGAVLTFTERRQLLDFIARLGAALGAPASTVSISA